MTPPDHAIPKIATMNGVEELQLEPEEAFVLSRVDGRASLKEIAQILGYDTARVWKLLDRAVQGGFVVVDAGKEKLRSNNKKEKQSILELLDEDEGNWDLKRIPREQRKAILMRYSHLGEQNHYQVLELKKHANDAAIKKAYFRLVKEFHPDKLFGMEAGHYMEKLDAIFSRVTEAFETLSDPVRRKSYERTLVQPTKKAADQEKPSSEGQKFTGKTLIERLALAKRHYEMAREEEMAGHDLAAANFFQLAVQFDPKNQEYARAWSRLKPVVMRKRSENVYSRGADALTRGDIGLATALLEETLQLNPRKKECYRDLAVLYLSRKTNLERARALSEKAVEFFPGESMVHSVLGRIYRELGDLKMARKELKVALKLDKENEGAREALEEIGGK